MKISLAGIFAAVILIAPAATSAQSLNTLASNQGNYYCPSISIDLMRGDCDSGTTKTSCSRQVPSPNVRELQKFLMTYYPSNTNLAASGKFLSGTRAAVQQFQLSTGLISKASEGGAVRSATRAKISQVCSARFEDTGKTTSSAVPADKTNYIRNTVTQTVQAGQNSANQATQNTAQTQNTQSQSSGSTTTCSSSGGVLVGNNCIILNNQTSATTNTATNNADTKTFQATCSGNACTTSITSAGTASCTLSDGRVIPHEGQISVFRREHGDEGGICAAYSKQVYCSNGKLVSTLYGGIETPEPKTGSEYPYARCFEDTTRDDRVESLLGSIYNLGLGRNYDSAGFAYWKGQLKAGAITADELFNQFLTIKKNGTDTISPATGSVTTKQVSATNPVFSGTANNSATLTFTIYYASGSTAERVPTIMKPVASNGTWTVTLGQPLKPGTYEYSLRSSNPGEVFGVSMEIGTLSVGEFVTQNGASTQGATAGSGTQTYSTAEQNARNTVSSAYLNSYQRQPTDAELTYWAGELVANRITEDKFRIQIQVSSYYVKILGRQADDAGLIYWVNQVTTGVNTMDTVKRTLCAQPEANATVCASTTL